jgi:hypothetical protein
MGKEGHGKFWLDVPPWLEARPAGNVDAPQSNGFLRFPAREPESRSYELIQTHPTSRFLKPIEVSDRT